MFKVRPLAVMATFFLATTYAAAQILYNDAPRAAAIALISKAGQNALNSQSTSQGAIEVAAYNQMQDVKALTKLQEEFNDYLDSFHDWLAVAAETYGLYNEVIEVSQNIKEIKHLVAQNPTNPVAVALSANRNEIYRRLVFNIMDLAMDIRAICFAKMKFTEAERIERILELRPKLRETNRLLKRYAKLIRYTSFLTVYNELMDRKVEKMYPGKQKRYALAIRALRRWEDTAALGCSNGKEWQILLPWNYLYE
jgi:hypothetical protein